VSDRNSLDFDIEFEANFGIEGHWQTY